MNYGVSQKKIVFRESDKKHAEFKIRLNYDGITQQQFFSCVIDAYVNKERNMMNFVSDLKENKKIHSKSRRRKSNDLLETGESTIRKFGLDENEIESIFDMIEGD